MLLPHQHRIQASGPGEHRRVLRDHCTALTWCSVTDDDVCQTVYDSMSRPPAAPGYPTIDGLFPPSGCEDDVPGAAPIDQTNLSQGIRDACPAMCGKCKPCTDSINWSSSYGKCPSYVLRPRTAESDLLRRNRRQQLGRDSQRALPDGVQAVLTPVPPTPVPPTPIPPTLHSYGNHSQYVL